MIKSKRLDTWDYQLFVSSAIKKKKFIIPSNSLTNNLGFREDATHTKLNMGDMSTVFKIDPRSYEKNFDKNYRKHNSNILIKIIEKIILK